MSENNNTTQKRKKQYRHLTMKERIVIETLIAVKDDTGMRIYNNSYIADYLNVHRSTISRELKQRVKAKIIVRSGKCSNLPYTAYKAQEDYIFKRGMAKAEYIVNKYPLLKKFIEDKILIDKWAPDVIAGYINKHELYLGEGFTSISTPTIYRAIHYGILKVRKKDTRRMLKFEKNDKYSFKRQVPENKKEYSIELRPEEINNRITFGHFELDTIVSSSKGNHKCLLTLTERMTRFELLFILDSKTKEEVINKFEMIKKYLKKDFSNIFKSITTDNGSEFAGFKEIIKKTNTKFYFCHPYASCEKGSNEKNNGIVRYFIPKQKFIENYQNIEINNIAYWMNTYPRKILKYSSAIEELEKIIKNKNTLKKLFRLQSLINS